MTDQYRTLDDLARRLTRLTVNLTPAAFCPVSAARGLVARVLRCCFLPLAHLDGGAREHAFWSVCATLHGLAQQPVPEGAERLALDDSDVVMLYRTALARHEDRLSAEEAAFLAGLGLSGVHMLGRRTRPDAHPAPPPPEDA